MNTYPYPRSDAPSGPQTRIMSPQPQPQPTTETARIAVYLEKGGTGKTTTTASLAHAIELDNPTLDVLAIDLAGKQGDLAKQFGVQPRPNSWKLSARFNDMWETVEQKVDMGEFLSELIIPTDTGVDLIPADQGLDGAENWLGTMPNDEAYSILDQFITDYLDPLYDVIILDIPGSSSNIAYNGLYAAQNVVVPARPGEFEATQAAALKDELDEFSVDYERPVSITMLIPTAIRHDRIMGKDALAYYRLAYSDVVSPKYVPFCEALRQAQSQGKTVFQFEQERSKTLEPTRQAYRANAAELLLRVFNPDEDTIFYTRSVETLASMDKASSGDEFVPDDHDGELQPANIIRGRGDQ